MSRYHVKLCNRELPSFDIDHDETILAAATRAGVVLPAGCRVGACRTCAARLRGGRVHMPTGNSLTQEMLDGHVVLTCIATVSSDIELDVGEPSRPLLRSKWILPWTD